MQLYWSTARLAQSQNVYGCFGTAKVSSRNRDCTAARPKYLLFCPSQNKSVNPCVVTAHLHTSWSILYTALYIERARDLWGIILHPQKALIVCGLMDSLLLKVGNFSHFAHVFLLPYFSFWEFCFPTSPTPSFHDSICSLEKSLSITNC